MMSRRPAFITLSFALLIASGCVPEPLRGFDDAGTANGNPNINIGDMGGGDTGPTNVNAGNFDPQFLQVSAIIKSNCLLAGCHGMGAGAVLSTVTGTNATDAEVQAALANSLPVPGVGTLLISPGSPSMSEVYIRITKMPGDALLMGQQTYGTMAVPLNQADIDTIGTWITSGANYMAQ